MCFGGKIFPTWRESHIIFELSVKIRFKYLLRILKGIKNNEKDCGLFNLGVVYH